MCIYVFSLDLSTDRLHKAVQWFHCMNQFPNLSTSLILLMI